MVLDSMNYIKGFRYQLYCMARAETTQHCVVGRRGGKEGGRVGRKKSVAWDTDRRVCRSNGNEEDPLSFSLPSSLPLSLPSSLPSSPSYRCGSKHLTRQWPKRGMRVEKIAIHLSCKCFKREKGGREGGREGRKERGRKADKQTVRAN